VALHYLTHYQGEYARARNVAKRRASKVVLWTAAANGAIALLGAATAVSGAAWLGLASTTLAGGIGVLAAWDALFKHRELWVQRSLILGQLQAVMRTAELRRAAGMDRDVLAADCLGQLNAILAEEAAGWADLRRSSAPPAPAASPA
jgi:hypothetical protein